MPEHEQPVTIIGNLGAEPELRFTPSGKAVVNLNIATHAGKDTKGKNQTAWVRVTCWNQLAETINSVLKKGDRVRLSGQLNAEIRTWEKHDKSITASYEMTAFEVVQLKREYSESPILAQAAS